MNRESGPQLPTVLRGTLAAAVILGLLLIPIPSRGAAVVMRVAAAVNETVLTTKDLGDFMALQELVPGPGGEPGAGPAASLAQLIDQTLILQEARRRQIVEVTKEEVDSEIRRRVALLGGEGSWERRRAALGLKEEEIRELVRRQLMARKYMDLRLRLFIQVSEEEIREYYEQHRRELGGVPLESVRGQIRQLLFARKFNVRLQDWIRDLRARADIRIPGEDLKLVGISDVPLGELFPTPRNPSKVEKPEETK